MARAQENEESATTPAVKSEAPAPLPPNTPPMWVIPSVRQLQPDAYPDGVDGGMTGSNFVLGKPTRGIYGGSLWLTFHGAQWPYMPKSGIGISGSGWIDSGYEQIKRPHDGSQHDSKLWLQQGRAVLRVTPTFTDGRFFVQLQGELVANKDQSLHQPDVADVDDLWVRIGQWNKWDLQVGRYESWEVFHLGMGLDVNTLERQGATQNVPVASPYLVRFDPNTRPSGAGYYGLHLYPTGFLRFELLGIAGNDAGLNTLGGRPAVIFDAGMIKFKVAGEYERQQPGNTVTNAAGMEVSNPQLTTQKGVGGGFVFILDPHVELGGNAAFGHADATDFRGNPDKAGTYDIVSLGGFANARIVGDLMLGAGAVYTQKKDENLQSTTNKVGYFDHFQSFGAVQYIIRKQLFIKLVAGYARSNNFASGATQENIVNMYSARLRFMYLF